MFIDEDAYNESYDEFNSHVIQPSSNLNSFNNQENNNSDSNNN